MEANGFACIGNHDIPVVPVYIKTHILAREVEDLLKKKGIYTIALSLPVVPWVSVLKSEHCVGRGAHAHHHIGEAYERRNRSAHIGIQGGRGGDPLLRARGGAHRSRRGKQNKANEKSTKNGILQVQYLLTYVIFSLISKGSCKSL